MDPLLIDGLYRVTIKYWINSETGGHYMNMDFVNLTPENPPTSIYAVSSAVKAAPRGWRQTAMAFDRLAEGPWYSEN